MNPDTETIPDLKCLMETVLTKSVPDLLRKGKNPKAHHRVPIQSSETLQLGQFSIRVEARGCLKDLQIRFRQEHTASTLAPEVQVVSL